MSYAGEYNIIIEQGIPLDKTFTYYQPDGTTPIDLSSYTAKMQARKQFDSVDTLLDLTTENGGIELGGAAGTVRVIAASSVTKTFRDNGVYDIVLYDENGKPDKFLKGILAIERSATDV